MTNHTYPLRVYFRLWYKGVHGVRLKVKVMAETPNVVGDDTTYKAVNSVSSL
jgi:hypothetical protein